MSAGEIDVRGGAAAPAGSLPRDGKGGSHP